MAKHADKFSLVRSVLPHRRGRPRHRPPDDADRAAVPGGDRARRTSAASLGYLKGPKGDVPPHVLLPRPIGNTGGNMPHGQTAGFLGKTHDPFVLNADPSDAGLQGARPAAARLPAGDPRRSPAQSLRDAGRRRGASTSRPAPDARLLDSNFEQAYRLMSSDEGARGVRPVEGAGRQSKRPLRPQPLRPELPAGAPADRGAACGSSRSTCSRRCSTRSPGTSTARRRSADRGLSRPASARCSTRPTARCSRTCTSAACCDDTLVLAIGRVRPHAEGQPRRRPRPLAAVLDHADGRRRRSRAGRSSARPTRSAAYPTRPPDRAARGRRHRPTRPSASTSRRRSPVRPTGRSRRRHGHHPIAELF